MEKRPSFIHGTFMELAFEDWKKENASLVFHTDTLVVSIPDLYAGERGINSRSGSRLS